MPREYLSNTSLWVVELGKGSGFRVSAEENLLSFKKLFFLVGSGFYTTKSLMGDIEHIVGK